MKKVLCTIWGREALILSVTPKFKEFTTVWKEYKWPIFSWMESCTNIPVNKGRVLDGVEVVFQYLWEEVNMVELTGSVDLVLYKESYTAYVKERILFISKEDSVRFINSLKY